MANPGAIEHEEVARRGEASEVGEVRVPEGRTITRNDQEAVSPAFARWVLCDEPGGKRIVEVGERVLPVSQRSSSAAQEE